MMAKMFYTLDETRAALGRGEEEIKQLSREGRLREFRDGPRLMFKADQVEQLKSELGSQDVVDIGVSDSGGLINMVDTTGASGTSITLSDADAGHSTGSGIRLADTSAGSMGGGMAGSVGGASASGLPLREDTALSMDMGLSGSLGGVPSPGRTGSGMAMPGGSLGGTSGGSRQGINVLGPDETGVERVDSSAQTVLSGGVRNQMALEGVGSGSGLLDLTRESDDTSLGAVLDEIGPAGTHQRGAEAEPVGLVDLESETAGPTRTAVAPQLVEAPDPMAAAFGGAALGGFVVILLGVYALISAAVGTRPDLVQWFGSQGDSQFWMAAGIGLGLAIVFGVAGLIVGRATTR